MKFRAVVEYDRLTKSYAVYCPELPGCTSAGDTKEEALRNIREAVALYLEPTPKKLKGKGEIFEVEIPA